MNYLLAQAKTFLNLFATHALTVEDADLAASLRREHRWKLPDALQAAMAINRRLSLVVFSGYQRSAHAARFSFKGQLAYCCAGL